MRDTSNDSHGTAVAGLLGAGGGFSISFTNIVNVKIFCQSEAATWMVAKAITDVTNEHRTFVRTRPAWFKGSVINLSFSTYYSPTTARAIEEASRAGIAIVTAAGNTDPPNPPRVASRNFPYYGSAVDIIAPGEKVHSLDAGGDLLGRYSSGTSVAAPIVGSVLAQFIAYERLMTDSRTIRQRLFDNALNNTIKGIPKSRLKALRTPNLFVNIPTNRARPRGPPYIGAPA
ncbi:MAG: serine protease [Bathelium mastoideum]|nr:MAG: serine protease [Bathelium mastoideum]